MYLRTPPPPDSMLAVLPSDHLAPSMKNTLYHVTNPQDFVNKVEQVTGPHRHQQNQPQPRLHLLWLSGLPSSSIEPLHKSLTQHRRTRTSGQDSEVCLGRRSFLERQMSEYCPKETSKWFERRVEGASWTTWNHLP